MLHQMLTTTVKAGNDLSSRNDLFKAITLSGDFALNGRTAVGLLLSNNTSGGYVTAGVVGFSKFWSYQANSFSGALMVQGSGYIAPLAGGNHEIGQCHGADGSADRVNPASGSLGAGFFNFATKPFYVTSIVANAQSQAVI